MTPRWRLVARLRPWRAPVVVHPQFTEPHAALEQAGHRVRVVRSGPGFAGLGPAEAPEQDWGLCRVVACPPLNEISSSEPIRRVSLGQPV